MVMKGMNREFRGKDHLRLEFIRKEINSHPRRDGESRAVHVAMCFQTDRVPVICQGGLTSTGLGPKAKMSSIYFSRFPHKSSTACWGLSHHFDTKSPNEMVKSHMTVTTCAP